MVMAGRRALRADGAQVGGCAAQIAAATDDA
jgi:hypothetical protein